MLALGRSAKPPAGLQQYATYLSADITTGIPSLEATVCIHCAGLASDKASATALNHVNITGTQNVFQQINCSHFVYLSSASVYPPNNLLHTEEEEIDEAALSPYGYSKLKAEEYLLQQQEKKRISILRPRGVYGIGDRILLPRILRLVKGPFLVTPANLQYHISITNIENLLYATDMLLQVPLTATAEIYNVVDDSEQTFEEVIRNVLALTGKKPVTQIKVPQRVLAVLGRLFPKSDINTNTLKYYLCNHVLSNEKIKAILQTGFPCNFNSYKSKYSKWIQQQGMHEIQKGSAALPWQTD